MGEVRELGVSEKGESERARGRREGKEGGWQKDRF